MRRVVYLTLNNNVSFNRRDKEALVEFAAYRSLQDPVWDDGNVRDRADFPGGRRGGGEGADREKEENVEDNCCWEKRLHASILTERELAGETIRKLLSEWWNLRCPGVNARLSWKQNPRRISPAGARLNYRLRLFRAATELDQAAPTAATAISRTRSRVC